MPKNKLFKRPDYSSKNYFFYPFTHFIFQNAFKFHFEVFPFNLFSAQSINTQNTPERSLQMQP
jgi:hypothetical protein